MSAFGEVLTKKNKKPEKHVVLQPNFFHSDCRVKPKEEVAIGLRRIADGDVQTARAEAAKYAVEMHDDHDGQVECYNDALMRWSIIFGTCDPNDVSRPAPFFDGSEENVRTSLTSLAIRFLWDEIDRFHVETSPIAYAATDEDIKGLCALLQAGPMPEMLTKGQILRIRKILGFVINEFREAVKTEDAVVEAITNAVNDDG